MTRRVDSHACACACPVVPSHGKGTNMIAWVGCIQLTVRWVSSEFFRWWTRKCGGIWQNLGHDYENYKEKSESWWIGGGRWLKATQLLASLGTKPYHRCCRQSLILSQLIQCHVIIFVYGLGWSIDDWPFSIGWNGWCEPQIP